MSESSEIQVLVQQLRKESRRRDELRAIENKVQAFWEEVQPFHVDAPAAGDADAADDGTPDQKFFTTFPYPYMNGLLHLGHAFSFSKNEISSSYFRMKGRRSLFPFSFHCTGMPIMAAAGRIRDELQLFGGTLPPSPELLAEVVAAEAVRKEEGDIINKAEKAAAAGKTVDPTKFRAKKGKAARVTVRKLYQHEILNQMEIPDADLKSFANPRRWLDYFPPLGLSDLKKFGLRADFRRSFITTDANPFYDLFIQWQFRVLKAKGLINFARSRPDVYSPRDGQSCADHDRSSGEGVRPVEYTLIKMEVLSVQPTLEPEPMEFDILDAEGLPITGPRETRVVDLSRTLPPVLADAVARGKRVFLLCATLRPETMYGQTNCWALPHGKYVVIEGAAAGDVFVLSAHAARNASFQNLTAERGETVVLGHVTGRDLIGLAVTAPLARYEHVFVLPMLTIKMDKGTGIVTSVPSDAPDDYQALKDLRRKGKNRAVERIALAMLEPFEPQRIVAVQGYEGKCIAVELCEAANVQSQNDRAKLDEAKATAYRLGFYKAVMAVAEDPEVDGKPVALAKPLIRARLLAAGTGVVYSEPESEVVSRSGDVCVVALTDQYFIAYGDPEWKKSVLQHATLSMNLFLQDVHNNFAANLEALHDWAVTRKFGLGTRLPGDSDWLIESLSDSTIYMAYYTIAHLLQGDCNLNGEGAAAPVDVAEVNDSVFEYIFRGGEAPALLAGGTLTLPLLERMRREFRYWYPVDIRTSGKDLLQNHLTFFVYNHCAIFEPEHWPRAIRINGHVLVDSAKMSKGDGNFFTLRQATEVFGADVTRLALADAGDAVEDANFSSAVVNSAILRLTRVVAWAHAALGVTASATASAEAGDGLSVAGVGGEDLQRVRMLAPDSQRDGDYNLMDRIFDAQLDTMAAKTDAAYGAYLFREALKWSFFELTNARQFYEKWCSGGVGLHRALVTKYLRYQALLLQPICPHVSQYLWWRVTGDAAAVCATAPFPTTTTTAAEGVGGDVLQTKDLLVLVDSTVLSEMQKALQPASAKKGKGKGKGKAAADEKKEEGAVEKPVAKPVVKTVTVSICDAPVWETDLIALLRSLVAADGGEAGVEAASIADRAAALTVKDVLPLIGKVDSLKPLLKRIKPVIALLVRTIQEAKSLAPLDALEAASNPVDELHASAALLAHGWNLPAEAQVVVTNEPPVQIRGARIQLGFQVFATVDVGTPEA